eukprot:GHVL01026372.1.p1 GENE.GHVL01026372.1~~GHVL01026372.1.p1  ORF type:complete len:132 (+),score=18.25 GHVL01026372.1:44-439(+)
MNWVDTGLYANQINHNRPIRVDVTGRAVAIFSYKDHFYCLDASCYHAGGPLEEAKDIEEINGEPCIRCPWHHFVISIKTGHSFYQPVHFDHSKEGRLIPVVEDWKSNGPKQRINNIKTEDGKIFIQLMEKC